MRSFVKNRALLLAVALAAPLATSGCISHAVHVEPITLAPIQMTVDVNLHRDPSDPPTSGSQSPTSEVSPAVTPR
jgi:hypothetical protein